MKKLIKPFSAVLLAGILTCGRLANACAVPVLSQQEEETGTEEASSDDLLREDYYEYVDQDLLDSVEVDPTEDEWKPVLRS